MIVRLACYDSTSHFEGTSMQQMTNPMFLVAALAVGLVVLVVGGAEVEGERVGTCDEQSELHVRWNLTAVETMYELEQNCFKQK